MFQTSPMRVESFSYQNVRKTFLWPGEWERSTSNRVREVELFSVAIATGAKAGKNAHIGTISFRITHFIGGKKAHGFLTNNTVKKSFLIALPF